MDTFHYFYGNSISCWSSLSVINSLIATEKSWFMIGLLLIILFSGALGGLIGFFYYSLQPATSDQSKSITSDQSQLITNNKTTSLLIYIVMGVGAALLVPLLLHILTSNLLSEIETKPEKSFILAGFCLAAAISSQYFISLIIKKFDQMTGSGQQP